MRTLFCLVGGDTVLDFALEDFGQEFSTIQKEVIVQSVEDMSVLGFIASGIKVGEKGLEFFVKQGFGFGAGCNGVHLTSVSEGSRHYNKPQPKFYAPTARRLTD
jgi:hypothetical protein